VFFFAPALEALGEAIKPYLQEGPAGPHVPCVEVDTAGAFVELTLDGRTDDGREVAVELMVPGNMVRMIVSARSDGEFGFYDRTKPVRAIVEPVVPVPPAASSVDAPATTEPAAPVEDAKPGA
jgi:hypothetical protein